MIRLKETTVTNSQKFLNFKNSATHLAINYRNSLQFRSVCHCGHDQSVQVFLQFSHDSVMRTVTVHITFAQVPRDRCLLAFQL